MLHSNTEVFVVKLNLPNSSNFKIDHSQIAMSNPFKYGKAARQSIVAVEKTVVADSE